jgi:hypothetical protein
MRAILRSGRVAPELLVAALEMNALYLLLGATFFRKKCQPSQRRRDLCLAGNVEATGWSRHRPSP